MQNERVNPEWNQIHKLENQNILFHKPDENRSARVTVGVPTYKRKTLERTLRSLALQSYKRFCVIVSDNAGCQQATLEAVRRCSCDLTSITLVAQPNNLGALGNLAFLLGCAKTDYFMWLADDDEINPEFIEALIRVLDEDVAAVCAMGRWKKMVDLDSEVKTRQVRLTSRMRAHRIIKFIAGNADDAFFYGLHRTENLRGCHFDGYFWPNNQTITNCCYVFLYDLVLMGPIRIDPKAVWISHNYSAKAYKPAGEKGMKEKVLSLIRRVNVHFLYQKKTIRRHPSLTPVAFISSIFGLATEVLSKSCRILLK
jgi:glycosyltransferase involved in cell wall biosynthesis